MSLTGKLSEEVAEGGDNFSTGQRQVKKTTNKLMLCHVCLIQYSIFIFS